MDIQTDLSGNVSASAGFPGMTVNGTLYTEKEPAAKALLDACKGIIGTKTDVSVGEYMGFKMSLRYESYGQQINLLMRGTMTYQIDLGTDALGNISRINNSLDKLPERLEGAKSQLESLGRQVEAAKLELEKPFELSGELEEKEARLAILNADLNIDGDSNLEAENDAGSRNEPQSDFYDEDEPDTDNYSHDGARVPQAVMAKAKPSILDGIRRFSGEQRDAASILPRGGDERGM